MTASPCWEPGPGAGCPAADGSQAGKKDTASGPFRASWALAGPLTKCTSPTSQRSKSPEWASCPWSRLNPPMASRAAAQGGSAERCRPPSPGQGPERGLTTGRAHGLQPKLDFYPDEARFLKQLGKTPEGVAVSDARARRSHSRDTTLAGSEGLIDGTSLPCLVESGVERRV